MTPGSLRKSKAMLTKFLILAVVRLVALPLLLACLSAMPWASGTRATVGAGHETAPVLALKEIAPGVFVSQGLYAVALPRNHGRISNIGFVVGRKAVAVIDTGGSAAVGRALMLAIRRVTQLPVRYVINTHMHPDHVFGNIAFVGDGVEFVGHHKLARALRAREAHYLKANKELLGENAFRDARIIPPTRDIHESLELDLGDRILRLTAHSTAHTDNDLTVLDRQTRTLWLGDLLFVRHIPVIDGDISGWLDVMKTLMAEDAARVVPGHGPASLPWPQAAEAQMRYLTGLAQSVRRYIKDGRTLGDAVQEIRIDETDNWLLNKEYHTRNIVAAFTTLEWE